MPLVIPDARRRSTQKNKIHKKKREKKYNYFQKKKVDGRRASKIK